MSHTAVDPKLILTADVRVERRAAAPMEAYFSAPRNAERVPGVIVIHEVFGLNANIRGVADRLAEQGYAALAVNLFTGNRVACLFRIMGGLMLSPLDNPGLRDLRDGIDWIKRRGEVDGSRIGVIGFCMGAGYALALACVNDDVKAAAPFYGMNPRPATALKDACPVVGSYPEKDFTRKAAVKLEELLSTYHVPHDIKIYPGARHSFFNEDGKAYNSNASADAWRRTLDFFDEHLVLRPSPRQSLRPASDSGNQIR
jgi:carboxymethylenebutenolidase